MHNWLWILISCLLLLACNSNRLVTKGRKHIKKYGGEYVYVMRNGYEDYYYQEPCSYFEEELKIYHPPENKKTWYIEENKETGKTKYFIERVTTTDREAVLVLKNIHGGIKHARFYNNRAKAGTQAYALGEVEYGNETYVTLKQNPANLEKRFCYDFNAIFEEYPQQWVQLTKQENTYVRLEPCFTKTVEQYTFTLSKKDCEKCKPQLTIKSKKQTYNITNAVKENGVVAINYSDNELMRNMKINFHPSKNEIATFVFTPTNVSLAPDTLYFAPLANAEKYELVKEECP